MQETLISESLERYVNGSRLSMSQIAERWGVSTALLSQIKNKKKTPSLDLGLKILRETGAPLDLRREWLTSFGKTQEVGLIIEDEKKERVEYKLKKSLSELFECNPILLDIFLDISFMKEKGFSWSGILKSYGEYGLSLVGLLIDSSIVEKRGDRYFIVKENIPHGINLESSFGIMKGTFDTLKQKVKKEEFRGEFHFDITDVSPQGYQKLKDLNIEYTKKAVAIIKENEMSRIKGGLRVVAQNIVALLKCFIFISLLPLCFNSPTFAQGSGLTGGGSGRLMQGMDSNISALRRSLKVENHGERLPYDIRTFSFGNRIDFEYHRAAVMTGFFASKEDVVDSVVEINKKVNEGKLSQTEMRSLMSNAPLRCSLSLKAQEKRALEKIYKEGKIKPLGFKVNQSYSPDGTPRFQGVIQFALPCVKE